MSKTAQSYKDSNSIALDRKMFKYFVIACVVLVALGFIPFEKEVSIPEYEWSTSYSNAYDFKFYVNKTNTSCLDDAWSMSNGDNEEYDRYAEKCESIPTGKTMRMLKLHNGPCHTRYDYTKGMIVSDCEDFYVNNGALYRNGKVKRGSDGNYNISYDDRINVQVVSGSSAEVKTYYTVSCRGFGLLCSKPEAFSEGTHLNYRLVIGEDFVIDKYNETCNGYSDRPLKDKDLCIYADAKAHRTTIKGVLDK